MTVENLEKELKQEKLHSVYLFYGEETYLLENAVKKIKKIFGDLILGINYIQINETNANGLISDIETPAFGYEKKLIIVKNSGILKKEKKSNFSTTKKQNLTPDTLSGKNKKGDPMKKAYSLNYDIYSTYDRIDAIAEILDELPQTPNHTDLE